LLASAMGWQFPAGVRNKIKRLQQARRRRGDGSTPIGIVQLGVTN
jgi:hypothetical protein